MEFDFAFLQFLAAMFAGRRTTATTGTAATGSATSTGFAATPGNTGPFTGPQQVDPFERRDLPGKISLAARDTSAWLQGKKDLPSNIELQQNQAIIDAGQEIAAPQDITALQAGRDSIRALKEFQGTTGGDQGPEDTTTGIANSILQNAKNVNTGLTQSLLGSGGGDVPDLQLDDTQLQGLGADLSAAIQKISILGRNSGAQGVGLAGSIDTDRIRRGPATQSPSRLTRR